MGWGIPTFMKQRNWSKVSSVFFMITPWKFLDWMLKSMMNPRQGISHEFWAILCLFWVSTPSLSAGFFVLWHLWGKIPLLSLLNGASFGCNHVQLVTWCYLMLRKSSTTGIMGYQNPTGYKILARQKKTQNHSLGNIFATWTEAKQQGSKHQTHHFIPTTIQKNPPKLIQMQNPLITIQRKKTIQNDVWFTPSHLFLVFLFPVFLGDPFCMTKLRLWSCEHLLRYTDVVAGALRIQHTNMPTGKKIPLVIILPS